MNKHLFLLLCLFVFNGYQSIAQLYQVSLDEKLKNSSLIIEGMVKEKKSFWNREHTMIYTSNTVEVYKSFKGNIQEKTIEVVTDGGSVGTDAVLVSDLLSLDVGQTGIFFCDPDPNMVSSPLTGKILYNVYSSDQGFLRYDFENNKAFAPFVTYPKIETNLYNTILQKTGQPLRLVNSSFDVSKTILEIKKNTTVTSAFAGSITSFTPIAVHGGALEDAANNQLTINGSGFGATPSGAAGVRFINASPSQSAYYTVGYNSFYIVSWSDTKIVVKVPDKAASGSLAVILSNGTVVQATSPLDVVYSVLNAGYLNFGGYDTVFAEARLMNTNTSGGYTFYYSTSTLGGGQNMNTAPEKATFQRALATWKEQVGLNFVEGGTTTIQAVGSDGKNVVMFDNTNSNVNRLPAGTLALTYSFFTGCVANSPFRVFPSQKKEFDVVLRNPGVSVGTTAFAVGPCFPKVSEYDLENTVLHELGHALNLAHINDDYQGGNIPTVNPAKLMHYSILNFVDRRSLDYSSYQGGLYTTTKQNYNYGTCSGIFASEMTQLAYTVIPNDECPFSFSATPTPLGTVVNFDLVHATSNKYKDPQYTAVNCSNTGTQVTNNAWYALRTSNVTNGTLTITISNYSTTPSNASSCTGQGVRLSVFDISSCPSGQTFPQPIHCESFAGDGVLSNVTGLQANHSYVLYFDGLRNTKASFNATLNGTTLPITLSKFTGEYLNGANRLYIDILQAVNVKTVSIEKGSDGIDFKKIGNLPSAILGKHTYIDPKPFAGPNFYRLKIENNDGIAEYSNIILLNNNEKRLIYIYPNPVKDILNINITATTPSKYQYFVYDASGKVLVYGTTNIAPGTQSISIPFNNVAKGMYLVKLTDTDGNVLSRKNVVKP